MSSPLVAGIMGAGRSWTAWMISVFVDVAQVGGGDPEVGVTQFSLDDQQWDSFSTRLNRVGVAELVRGEPPALPCHAGGSL